MEDQLEEEKKDNLWRGVQTAVGSICMHVFLGSFYSWGQLNVYVTSYLYQFDQSLSLSITQLVFPLQLLVFTLFLPVGLYLRRTFHPRVGLLAGSVCVLLGLLIASFMHTFLLFAFFYGVFFGAGMGIAYLNALMGALEHFPRKKEALHLLLLLFFGLGSLLTAFVSAAVVNPHNE